MNAFTRMSEKGQVVVPAETRRRLGWAPGTDLEVIDIEDGVMLRPRQAATPRLSLDEAVARLRAIYRHQGPPVPLDAMGEAAAAEAAERDDRSR